MTDSKHKLPQKFDVFGHLYISLLTTDVRQILTKKPLKVGRRWSLTYVKNRSTMKPALANNLKQLTAAYLDVTLALLAFICRK